MPDSVKPSPKMHFLVPPTPVSQTLTIFIFQECWGIQRLSYYFYVVLSLIDARSSLLFILFDQSNDGNSRAGNKECMHTNVHPVQTTTTKYSNQRFSHCHRMKNLANGVDTFYRSQKMLIGFKK